MYFAIQIIAYSKIGDEDRATAYYRKIKIRELTLSPLALAGLIVVSTGNTSELVAPSIVAKTLDLHSKNVDACIVLCHALIRDHIKRNDAEAPTVIELMRKRGLPLRAETYNILIQAALHMDYGGNLEDIPPLETPFEWLSGLDRLSSDFRKAQFIKDEVNHYFIEMRCNGISPNMKTIFLMLEAYLQNNELKEASDFVKEYFSTEFLFSRYDENVPNHLIELILSVGVKSKQHNVFLHSLEMLNTLTAFFSYTPPHSIFHALLSQLNKLLVKAPPEIRESFLSMILDLAKYLQMQHASVPFPEEVALQCVSAAVGMKRLDDAVYFISLLNEDFRMPLLIQYKLFDLDSAKKINSERIKDANSSAFKHWRFYKVLLDAYNRVYFNSNPFYYYFLVFSALCGGGILSAFALCILYDYSLHAKNMDSWKLEDIPFMKADLARRKQWLNDVKCREDNLQQTRAAILIEMALAKGVSVSTFEKEMNIFESRALDDAVNERVIAPMLKKQNEDALEFLANRQAEIQNRKQQSYHANDED